MLLLLTHLLMGAGWSGSHVVVSSEKVRPSHLERLLEGVFFFLESWPAYSSQLAKLFPRPKSSKDQDCMNVKKRQ